MKLTVFATVLITKVSVIAAFGINDSRKLHRSSMPSRVHVDPYLDTLADKGADHNSGAPFESITDFPKLSPNGVYEIETEEQHAAFLEAHPDKLIVLKFYASYCRSCMVLDPKFLNVKNSPQLQGLPIVWAECKASRHNKQFFKKLGVLALPTVHFYDGSNKGGLVENFQCGPKNIPLLKKKLASFLNTRVDPETLQLQEAVVPMDGTTQLSSSGPRVERDVSMDDDNTFISKQDLEYLRNELPFFADLTKDEFSQLLQKAKLQSFNAGDVIIRQGEPGRNFYMMISGWAEMSIKSRYEDPISTPPTYLGAVVNQLKQYDYFGERALTTGEPYAASVRVLEKTRCLAFHVEDIPESCILSKQRRATQDVIDQLSERYELPDDYYEPQFPTTTKDENILELLVRFKQIRQAAKCFDYIMDTDPTWGNTGEIARRSFLVSKLSTSQRDEFREVFNLADVNQDGMLTLLEMRKFMESARKDTTDDVLLQMIHKANPRVVDGAAATEYGITLNEFLGVMAEAEFYSLFIETFQVLDLENTGYVRAGDLEEVLHGVRGLISDDRKSIIDVEDKDVQVDYEQFSKMLLGAGL